MKQRWDVAPHPGAPAPRARACAGGGTGLAMASPAVGAKQRERSVGAAQVRLPEPAGGDLDSRRGHRAPRSRAWPTAPCSPIPPRPPKRDQGVHRRPRLPATRPQHRALERHQPRLRRGAGPLWSNAANARTVADAIKRKVDGILTEIRAPVRWPAPSPHQAPPRRCPNYAPGDADCDRHRNRERQPPGAPSTGPERGADVPGPSTPTRSSGASPG